MEEVLVEVVQLEEVLVEVLEVLEVALVEVVLEELEVESEEEIAELCTRQFMRLSMW